MVALPRMKGAPPKKSIQKKAPTPKAEAPRQQQRPGGGKKKVYDSGSDSDDMDEDVQINTVSSGKKRGKDEDVKKPASKKSKTGDESSQATKKGSKDSKAKVGKEDKAKAGKKRKERDDDSDDESDAEERRQKNINADGTSPLTNFKVCRETIAKLEAGGIKALFPVSFPSHPPEGIKNRKRCTTLSPCKSSPKSHVLQSQPSKNTLSKNLQCDLNPQA
jgi:hypothetical protein